MHSQQTIAYNITASSENKYIHLYNTLLPADSVQWQNKANKKLPTQDVFATEFPHIVNTHITLFETQGSALQIDTAGNFFMLDIEKPDAKPIALKINIKSLGLGTTNLVIECSNRDLENLVVYVVPFAKYRIANAEPIVTTKLSFRLEEIIYGAKGKLPPRIIEEWREQIRIEPENRKILYDLRLILPKSMATRGTTTMIIYDLSYQVVAIFPNLKSTVNVIKRDNIITNTYVYKIFFNNDEEIKKGLIHFLSPEDEQKKKEEEEKKQQAEQAQQPE